MGQTKSKDCADKKGTDSLSAQAVVNDIDILRRLAQNEGPIAVSQYIDKSLNRWKKEQVKFAITGRSADVVRKDEEKIVIRYFHLTYIIFFLKCGRRITRQIIESYLIIFRMYIIR
jgi:hypothetical protein